MPESLLPCSNGNVSNEEKTAVGTLDLRQAVRQAFMAGRIDEASQLLRARLPRLLEAEGGDSKPDLDVYFHVNVMKFIELLRCMPNDSNQPSEIPCLLIEHMKEGLLRKMAGEC